MYRFAYAIDWKRSAPQAAEVPCINALGESKTALTVFKSGDHKSALPLPKAEWSTDKQNLSIKAALVAALVYEGKLEEAADLSRELAQGFPNAPEALAGEHPWFTKITSANSRRLRKCKKRWRNTRPAS